MRQHSSKIGGGKLSSWFQLNRNILSTWFFLLNLTVYAKNYSNLQFGTINIKPVINKYSSGLKPLFSWAELVHNVFNHSILSTWIFLFNLTVCANNHSFIYLVLWYEEETFICSIELTFDWLTPHGQIENFSFSLN